MLQGRFSLHMPLWKGYQLSDNRAENALGKVSKDSWCKLFCLALNVLSKPDSICLCFMSLVLHGAWRRECQCVAESQSQENLDLTGGFAPCGVTVDRNCLTQKGLAPQLHRVPSVIGDMLHCCPQPSGYVFSLETMALNARVSRDRSWHHHTQ